MVFITNRWGCRMAIWRTVHIMAMKQEFRECIQAKHERKLIKKGESEFPFSRNFCSVVYVIHTYKQALDIYT